MWLGQHVAMPRPALLSPGSTLFIYIIICIRYSVNANQIESLRTEDVIHSTDCKARDFKAIQIKLI